MRDLVANRPRNRTPGIWRAFVLLLLIGLTACAGPDGPAPRLARAPNPTTAAGLSLPARAAATAESMIGTPYRYGGTTPRGFDCSGLVVYSYRRAGQADLPRTVAALERASQPVALKDVRPGDLLFFRLSGKKTNHVALVLDGSSFVHAPSSGKRVEKVRFDHVYWSPRLKRAGRVSH
jgi:cell wall-associated NlpC family hydrolase